MHFGGNKNCGWSAAALLPALFAIALSGCGSDKGDSPATADSAQPAQDAPATAGTGTAQTARAVISERLPYVEVDDELVYGYFVFPSDMIEPLPAVIMIHERWGLTDDLKARADQLAAEGFIVLAIDLFQGKTATEPAEARELMLTFMKTPEHAEQNIQGAYEFIQNSAEAPRVATLGYGVGGSWALKTAILMPEDLDAVVMYYGQVDSDEDKLRPVTAPILAVFADNDRNVPQKTIEEFEAALGNLRKNFEIKTYPDTGGGFANPGDRRYDPSSTEAARQQVLEFLHLHLSIEES